LWARSLIALDRQNRNRPRSPIAAIADRGCKNDYGRRNMDFRILSYN